jgi:hypothetical protein
MKRILFPALIFSLVLVSCEKTPVAVFHTDTLEPEVGQEITFYNDSHDATRFEWDFGDGYFSHDVNPRHAFNATGSYKVMLTAISKSNLEDEASLTLDVVVPTLLEIQVLEYYQEYVVPDASIILYPTLGDWDAQTNSIIEGFTDQYGVAVFAGLENKDYYLDIWEQNHDNYTLRLEDPGFIRVTEVVPHQINYFVAYVDYVQHGKGTARGTRTAVIKKIVRKSADKVRPPFDPSLQNWQDLYNRSIK